MKSGAVLAAILSGHAAVASLSPRLDRRQIDPETGMIIAKLVGPKGSAMIPGLVKSLINKGYGKVRDVPSAAPKRQVLESRAPHLKATTVKIRYGPYKVPSAKRKNIVGEQGTLYNWPDLNVAKPCDDCVLVGISAGLEFPNGTEATTSKGYWLHHMVMMNIGPDRMDPTCVGKTSLPHLLLNTTPSKAERVFSSGNERSRVLFTPPFAPNAKMGYFLNKADKFSFIVDLMNMNNNDETLYMTLTYDYLDGRPAGFDNMKAIWLDAAPCGTSEVKPPKETGAYMINATWTANIEGEILGGGGHVHDGGTHLTLSVDGKLVCDSVATYGVGGKGMGGMGMAPTSGGSPAPASNATSPGAGDHGTGGHSGNGEHIVAMSECDGAQMGKYLKKGQKWDLKAYYDYDKHPGMKHDNGKQENVMGISIIYIKNPKM